MVRILSEANCGLTYHSGDSSELAANVIKIKNTENNFSANGIKAVKEKFNWAGDQARILSSINNLR